MPTPDLFSRKDFGGNEREAEVIANYRRSHTELRKIESQSQTAPKEDDSGAASGGGRRTGKKADPKGKAKAKATAERDA